jgi:hypothetical protein
MMVVLVHHMKHVFLFMCWNLSNCDVFVFFFWFIDWLPLFLFGN